MTVCQYVKIIWQDIHDTQHTGAHKYDGYYAIVQYISQRQGVCVCVYQCPSSSMKSLLLSSFGSHLVSLLLDFLDSIGSTWYRYQDLS